MSEPLVRAGPSAIHGTGLFANADFDTGDHIGTYTGRPTAVDGTHVLWVEGDDGDYTGIDGTGDLRWLNHSRTPNVEFDGPELFALHPISIGDELVFDYGEDWDGVD